ncbi:hypothetical protein L6164_037303 [Bauhinia variegata]|uniref:Uncharacterized protein n=1 Tax=Bauhinia variegata TaxID=167791 RepID=A0ACB9KJM6_BAUVA|nr:hypothetical protein L6164_037303 [Bauhinia variegata]
MRSFLRSCYSAASSKLPISELSQAKEADTVTVMRLISLFFLPLSLYLSISVSFPGISVSNCCLCYHCYFDHASRGHNKIRERQRYIFQGKQILEDVVEAPDPILNLATDLAVAQLIQAIKDEFRFRFSNVRMTTRNNIEKRAVLAKIEAALNKENMTGSGKRLERVISVDVSKCKNDDEVRQELVAQLGLHTIDELLELITKKNYLLLLMDGDGRQNIDPGKAGCGEYNKKTFAVFITTESSAVRGEQYIAYAYGIIEIRTEDHLLPWVVFCRNVGCDLVRSSTGIHRIAVQRVEECRCHLQST